MEHVPLGGSGLQVSRLALGTMIFGSQLDEAAAHRVLDRALDLGIDFWDLADVYPVPPRPETAGRTEEIVGRWLRSRPGSPVLATKCVGRVGPGANDEGGGRKHVIEACEASLRRLGRERVDVFYLHHSELRAPLEETLEALDRLVQAGKTHYVGLSNFEAWQVGLAMALAGERRLTPLTVVQPRYNLLNRGYERELVPLCRARGIGLVPYNPLGAGVLAGRYRRGQPPPAGSRFSLGAYGDLYRSRYLHDDAVFDVVEAVQAVAAELGGTAAQVAVAWLLAQPGVTAPIVGASRPEQLEDSAGALGLRLTPAQLDRLSQVSQPFR